ncbi:MAG: exodeoxyribonuclease V subunit gamma [Thermomonas sp.]
MPATPIQPVQQLAVFRASRVERLLAPMQTLLQMQGPAHPLAPVQVVVGHAGLRPWLLAQLARAAGCEGIAANIEVMLPSTWLERLAQNVLGESAVALAPYRREILRWRIHALLPQLPLAEVQAYLRDGDAARRRFQLADHLAGLFGRYSVYRPDWLAAWARGNDRIPADAAASPLPWLWKRLRADIAQPHRGERLQQLAAALADGHPAAAGDGSALHLFGISHLAPGELAVFAALSAQRPVALYLPDPCRERDWVLGLPADRGWLHAAWASEEPDQADAAFLAQPHPLLAAWGRMGQEFLLALEDHQLLADVRDASDAEDADSDVRNRLQRLQDSLRRREVALLAPVTDTQSERGDASLRVHACHTRLRELEVLRDALLDALAKSPDLTAADIVVMAPDITAYAPLLPAVFGEPGVATTVLPYHLADVPLTAAHPLLQAYARLLDLPLSRLPVAEVLDLLRTPAIMLRSGLDAGGVARIEGWLRQANVVWALDAAQRVRDGLPDIATHSFAWGVDRLLAAHVFGHADDAVALPEGALLPAQAAIEGPQANELGALDGLLLLLAEWQREATQLRSATVWAKYMEAQLDALFRVAPQDAAGNEALGVLRGLVRDLADVPGLAGMDPELDYAVIREVLQAGLQAVPARQRFLSGSMTVCGMVPQRAIPFRVIAVLGLDEGAFPRPARGDGLDLMVRHRRSGDRGLRDDDRWLFLETVMAARERLHLSYIGEGVRDGKSRNPAAPLAELMAALDQHAPPQPCVEGATPERQRPWLVQHPLQPFDPRYFDDGKDADPALFSHRDAFAAASQTGSEIPRVFADLLKPLRDASAVTPPMEPLQIAKVLGYFRDPARQLLRDGLGLRLDAADQFDIEEPLDATVPPMARLPQRLLRMAIEKNLTTLPEYPPAWLAEAGLLASGRPGQQAWREKLRDPGNTILQSALELQLFKQGWPKPWPIVEASINGWHLTGRLPDAVIGPNGAPGLLALYPGKKMKELDYGKRIPLLLQWALLRLDPALADRPVEIVWLLKEPPGEDAPWQAWEQAWQQAAPTHRESMRAQLTTSVTDLLALFQQAQEQPSAYFPKAASAGGNSEKEWVGGFNKKGERDYAPGYARLLAGELTFADGAEQLALQAVVDRIEAALALPLGDAA